MSRILFPAKGGGAVIIHLGVPSLGASSSYLRTWAGSLITSDNLCHAAGVLALLPVGFTWPSVSPQAPVRSYRTLSPLPGCPGGLLSVALSRGSLRVAVSNHRALWSPDFPRPPPAHLRGGTVCRDHPADSFAWVESTPKRHVAEKACVVRGVRWVLPRAVHRRGWDRSFGHLAGWRQMRRRGRRTGKRR